MNKIREVSKDIIHIKVTGDQTLNQLIKQFYAILAKHKIKRHTKTKNGKRGANFEYTICKTLFTDRIKSAFTFMEWDLPSYKFTKLPKNVDV